MLCINCNNLQSEYDPAYATFVKSLLPWWIKSSLQLTGMEPPHIELQAGAVARSILIGMFGLNPQLKVRHPEIVNALIGKSSILNMPADARLYLALARGFKAQVTGYRQIRTSMAHRPLEVESLAQVYFPPLAWILADEEKSLLEFGGWVDVSSWLALQPMMADYLDNLVSRRIPIIHLPEEDPFRTSVVATMTIEGWSEHFECDDVNAGLKRLC